MGVAKKPPAKKQVLKKPSGKDSQKQKKKAGAWAVQTESEHEKNEEATENEENDSEKASDDEVEENKSKLTEPQRHVWKRAMEGLPGVNGNITEDVKQMWRDAKGPKAKAAVVNSILSKKK